MYRISKEFTFAMGHRLSNHKGACRNFHGHNYTVIVGLQSKFLNADGMVMDFSVLKEMVNEYLDELDHALMVNSTDEDFVIKIQDHFSDMKIVVTPYDPTAENMAREIYTHISKVLNPELGVDLDYVTVYETDTSQATYSYD